MILRFIRNSFSPGNLFLLVSEFFPHFLLVGETTAAPFFVFLDHTAIRTNLNTDLWCKGKKLKLKADDCKKIKEIKRLCYSILSPKWPTLPSSSCRSIYSTHPPTPGVRQARDKLNTATKPEFEFNTYQGLYLYARNSENACFKLNNTDVRDRFLFPKMLMEAEDISIIMKIMSKV